MTLPSNCNPISFSQIDVELGFSSTAQVSLNDTAVRTLFGVASGAISLSNGWGKSNAPGWILAFGTTTSAATTGNYYNCFGFAMDPKQSTFAIMNILNTNSQTSPAPSSAGNIISSFNVSDGSRNWSTTIYNSYFGRAARSLPSAGNWFNNSSGSYASGCSPGDWMIASQIPCNAGFGNVMRINSSGALIQANNTLRVATSYSVYNAVACYYNRSIAVGSYAAGCRTSSATVFCTPSASPPGAYYNDRPIWRSGYGTSSYIYDVCNSPGTFGGTSYFLISGQVCVIPYAQPGIAKYSSNPVSHVWTSALGTFSDSTPSGGKAYAFRAIKAASSGNIYALMQNNYGSQKAIVAKFNAAGTLQWNKYINATYAGVTGPTFFAQSNLEVDSSENIYIPINMLHPCNPYSTGYIIKLNSSGSIVWQNKLNVSATYSSCYSFVFGYNKAIKIDQNNNIIIAGSTSGLAQPLYHPASGYCPASYSGNRYYQTLLMRIRSDGTGYGTWSMSNQTSPVNTINITYTSTSNVSMSCAGYSQISVSIPSSGSTNYTTPVTNATGNPSSNVNWNVNNNIALTGYANTINSISNVL